MTRRGCCDKCGSPVEVRMMSHDSQKLHQGSQAYWVDKSSRDVYIKRVTVLMVGEDHCCVSINGHGEGFANKFIISKEIDRIYVDLSEAVPAIEKMLEIYVDLSGSVEEKEE